MTDIFISYSRNDQQWVAKLAQALSELGYVVWWDTQLIAGDDFMHVIPTELEKARCVIVVWSTTSVTRNWVRAEVNSAANRKVLIPISMEPSNIPIPFNLLHAQDMQNWNGKAEHPDFQRLLPAIARHCPLPQSPPHQQPDRQAPVHTRKRRSWFFPFWIAVTVLVGSSWYWSYPSEAAWIIGSVADQMQYYTTAAHWYEKAAEQGHFRAQNNLGVMYQYGKGLKQNDTEALKWYEAAAAQGNATAQNNLGWMYESGQGVRRDDTKALEWYEAAAAQGNASAQFNLGVMYQYGKGVKQDNAEALKWYQKSAEQGDVSSKSAISELTPSLESLISISK